MYFCEDGDEDCEEEAKKGDLSKEKKSKLKVKSVHKSFKQVLPEKIAEFRGLQVPVR